MSLVVQEFTYEQRDELALLLTDLLDGRGQFSVCPNPPDRVVTTRTGWVVSYPPLQVNHTSKSKIPDPEAA